MRLPITLNPFTEKLAGVERLRQAEAKTTLRHEPDFLLACSVGSGSTSGRAHSGTNNSALASADQCAQQRASASAPADESEIAFLVTAAAHEHAVGLQWHGLAIQRDG